MKFLTTVALATLAFTTNSLRFTHLQAADSMQMPEDQPQVLPFEPLAPESKPRSPESPPSMPRQPGSSPSKPQQPESPPPSKPQQPESPPPSKPQQPESPPPSKPQKPKRHPSKPKKSKKPKRHPSKPKKDESSSPENKEDDTEQMQQEFKEWAEDLIPITNPGLQTKYNALIAKQQEKFRVKWEKRKNKKEKKEKK